MQNTFSFRTSLKKSWSIFKTKWVLLVGASLGYYIITVIFSTATDTLGGITGFIISLIGTIITLIILLGYYTTVLKLLEIKPVSFTGLISIPSKLFWKGIFVQIGTSFIRLLSVLPIIGISAFFWFILGKISFISPAIFHYILLPLITLFVAFIGALSVVYITIHTQFALFLLIEKYTNTKPWDIIKQAWKSTKDKEWFIIKLVIKVALLNLLGLLLVGFGLFITVPLSMLIIADFYRTHINPKSGTNHTEPVHTDMVVKSPEIEAPESETETVTEETLMDSETIAEDAETISETGDSETATV